MESTVSHIIYFFYLSVTGSAIFLQKKFCRGSPVCGFLIQFRPNSPPSKMTHDVPHYFYYRLIMYLIVFEFNYWNNTSKSYIYLLTCKLNIQSIITRNIITSTFDIMWSEIKNILQRYLKMLIDIIPEVNCRCHCQSEV